MCVCVTKSLIQFYKMHTPIYTQSASYFSIEGHMHVMDKLHATIGCMRSTVGVRPLPGT
jgi:hypothetical protein